MTRKDIEEAVESFRHAIVYLIQEARRSGLIRLGASLKLAEKSIEEDLKLLNPPNENRPDETRQKRNTKPDAVIGSEIDD